MGYRISLYCTPKEQVDAIRNITDKEVNETDGDVLNQLHGEFIKYDTLANVLDTGYEEKYNLCSRVFNNRLSWEDDCSYYTISKEQLRNIIMYICENNNYKFLNSRCPDYENKEPGEWYKNRTYLNSDLFDENLKDICRDYKYNTESWKTYQDENGNIECRNIDLENKWFITNIWSYQYCVLNFVYLYKIFDWEHNYLIAIGG